MDTKPISKINNISLKTKLLLSFSIIVFSLVFLTLYATQTVAVKHSKRILDENIKVSESVITNHIHDIAKVINKAATNLASDFSLKSLVLNASQDNASLNVAMNNFANRFDTNDFAVLSPSGKVIAKSAQFTLSEIEHIEVYTNEQGGWLAMNDTYYLTVIVPVKNTPLSRNAMAHLLFSIPINKIFNNDLTVLSNLHVAVLANNRGNQQHVISSNFDSTQIKPMLDNKRLIEGTLYSSTVDQQSYFGSILPFAKQPNVQMSLLLFTEEEKAFLSYSALLKNIIILLVLAGIFVLIFALLFSEILTRPLLLLSDVASKIGSGDHEVSVPKGNTKEVNRLAAAISNMNDNLNTRNKEVHKLAFEDDLTGLPNRNAFYQFVDSYIQKNPKANIGMILLDISKFTGVNEAIGYKAADYLLEQIACRLVRDFSQHLLVIRMSGNQFAILIENDSEYLDVINLVTQCLHQPFCINDLTIGVGANIGYATTDVSSRDSRALAQAADTALRIAKTSYASHVVFDRSLALFDSDKLMLIAGLSTITEDNRLSLHYQPQLCLTSQQIKSVECLARWTHPELGFVPPDVFIALAESSGHIKTITRFVINEALKQHCEWRKLGYELVMAVNISTIDLADEDFVNFVSASLDKYKIAPNFLIIEVTESAAMDEPEQAIKSLNRISELGVKLSIDDFGTGYSSMAQLKQMPVQELKIDKAFVLNLAKEQQDQAMVATFISLAKNLGLSTVAEGVEDEASLKILAELGCSYAQGYYISRPLSKETIIKWFEENKPLMTSQASTSINDA